MPTVVQFGAGNVGRGFMGQVFTEAGFEVVFVDVVPETVALLNDRREYPLRLVGPDRFETLAVRPVRAVDANNLEVVARELACCDLACTAVGVPVLPHVAPALAEGIHVRKRALNVILCENQLRCSDLLRGLLRSSLAEAEVARLGLVESVVSRMVPVAGLEERAEDPLLVVAEDYSRLPVDRGAFLGEIPPVPALEPVDDFAACFERKLYVHNLGHAAAAYLGAVRGCRYVHVALGIPEVRAVVVAAMEEAAEALARKHGFDRAEMCAHRENLLRRFENAALGDTVLRVGRDPARKLRAEDRLTGAALTCLDWGVEPAAIVRAIVAAFRFDSPDDPSAQAVRRAVENEGAGEAILRFTGQSPQGELGRMILEAWEGA